MHHGTMCDKKYFIAAALLAIFLSVLTFDSEKESDEILCLTFNSKTGVTLAKRRSVLVLQIRVKIMGFAWKSVWITTIAFASKGSGIHIFPCDRN